MAAKMKGLLKGFRFISHIFDTTSSKESSEMQIGYPTDVKHIAHIGWDGQGSAPSWMKEFSTVPSVSSGPLLPPAVTPKEPIPVTSVSQDLGVAVLVQRSPRRIRNKARLRHLLDGSSSEIHPLGKPLSHRPVVDTISSPHSHEASESSTKSSRRRQTQGILGSDSSSDQDSPRSPRPHSRPRRPRGSSSKSRLSTGFTREGLTLEPSGLNQCELENGIKC